VLSSTLRLLFFLKKKDKLLDYEKKEKAHSRATQVRQVFIFLHAKTVLKSIGIMYQDKLKAICVGY
jgi:hypothetical protein